MTLDALLLVVAYTIGAVVGFWFGRKTSQDDLVCEISQLRLDIYELSLERKEKTDASIFSGSSGDDYLNFVVTLPEPNQNRAVGNP